MRGIVFFAALLVLAAGFASAAPAAPEVIVKVATNECADFSRGDECAWCDIPEGWISLGYGTTECPPNYTRADVEIECVRAKTDFCCTEGHSGADGDCDALIINDLNKRCRFRNGGPVPYGWKEMPAGAGSWLCPDGYVWTDGEDEGGVCAAIAVPLIVLAFSRRC